MGLERSLGATGLDQELLLYFKGIRKPHGEWLKSRGVVWFLKYVENGYMVGGGGKNGRRET